jgi:hypothetical protein
VPQEGGHQRRELTEFARGATVRRARAVRTRNFAGDLP